MRNCHKLRSHLTHGTSPNLKYDLEFRTGALLMGLNVLVSAILFIQKQPANLFYVL
jgi:hypothetical protein